MQARLQEVVDGLEPLDREILALRHYEELTNQEAAEELGITPAAASKRYIRALERLKTALAKVPGCCSGKTESTEIDDRRTPCERSMSDLDRDPVEELGRGVPRSAAGRARRCRSPSTPSTIRTWPSGSATSSPRCC